MKFPKNDEKTWQKRSHGDSESIWDSFTCWLSKRVLQRQSLESGLTKIFTVSNFGNTLAMTIILFLKMLKIWCRVHKWNTKLSKNLQIWDNIIQIGNFKFSQSWAGYLALAVNVLTYTPKISPNASGDVFGIIFPENDETTRQKRSHRDFVSIWDAFTCWLSKRVLKKRLLESGLTKIFTVSTFGNTLAMTIILFFKTFKSWYRFQKWDQKFQKTFSFSR